MTAFLDRIDAINPRVNAIVSRVERPALLAQAAEYDARAPMGPLHGLPMAVKDLEAVAGLPNTQGSPLFRDHVAEADSLMVARLRAAGAIFIGKTNVPEFGFGSHTYNTVFGTTLNAYDQSRSAGGSSGGAAVALATRMVPLADGSDHAGSLRNPAAFNNVLRLPPELRAHPPRKRRMSSPRASACSARWRAASKTSLCCSRCRRDTTRARRSPSGKRARA